MSGAGAPKITVDGRELKVAIVAASWHTTIMDALVAGAQECLAEAGCTDVDTVRVPGSFELPVVAAELAKTNDAVVALGVVIRGGTPHFDYVCEAATMGLTTVSLQTETAIGFGVLTCDDEDQARDRAGLPGSSESKGHEAASAALATAARLRDLRSTWLERGE
ncbi:6,7-dimethyl-8-ribityllumazine synthase [Mobilicoccus sp.]|uniref:6,7-dimethyl-8-ribityllumazine synthase n=1 Tax=Mobilicoccus sp. TaxID=2034349 RepID=UPI00289AD5E9|nr:6,7-dimethyl-8-ribityllumazine synthase [Mobilicoccus sp.]